MNPMIYSKPIPKKKVKRGLTRSGFKKDRNSRLSRTSFKKKAPDLLLQDWREKVLDRDKNTCQFPGCGSVSSSNDSHHIVPRSRRPDLKYIVSNGVTLDRRHHNWAHKNPREATEMGLLSDVKYEAS